MIREAWLPEGGFLHWSMMEEGEGNTGVNAPVYRSTFTVAQILSCLYEVKTESAVALGKVIARFLEQQKSSAGSFNYWLRNSREAAILPYPDDLDDTFLALAALQTQGSAYCDGSVLARAAQLLIAREIGPGGPYRTWIMPAHASEVWQDVDPVVNGNINYFLSRIGVRLVNLAAYFDDYVRRGRYVSRYYFGEMPVMYAIARAYTGKYASLLAPQIQNYSPKNILEIAMKILALIELGHLRDVAERDVAALMEAAERGKWECYPFWVDPTRDGFAYYAGAPSLTAAFSTAALAKYLRLRPTAIQLVIPAVIPERSDRVVKIKKMASVHCASLPHALKEAALAEIAGWREVEAILLPYRMYEAIWKITAVPERILDELAVANLFGWMAYSIYDDILDEVAGSADRLPVANFFLRQLITRYDGLDQEMGGMRAIFEGVMNRMADANLQERRGVALEVIADKSSGHMLAALGVLRAAGYALDSREVGLMVAWFNYYLAARQLHDDAHDWKEDFLRGQVNSAMRFVMETDRNESYTTDDIPELKLYFWRTAIPDIVSEIKRFVGLARDVLRNLSIIENQKPLEELLSYLETSADVTLRERHEVIHFMNTYQEKRPVV
jgi:hypothetical protein